MLIDVNLGFPRMAGWVPLLQQGHGFADIVRELITTYGCDRNAVIGVSRSCLESCWVAVALCLIDVL